MGKRSTNTTKSGKFMNPTDQARKEARKRELKKNKKQRMMVRQAVLKGKDPMRLITEMAEIDDMEYDPTVPPSLGEKVLRDKRKKLMETFERVINLYDKEDPTLAVDLKKAFTEYNQKRIEKQTFYDEVKNAERVQLDQIPLPDAPLPPGIPLTTPDIPLPQAQQLQPPQHSKSILKKTSQFERPEGEGKKKPPGPPPGPPPPLSDSEDEGSTTAAAVPAEAAKARKKVEKMEIDTEGEPAEDAKPAGRDARDRNKGDRNDGGDTDDDRVRGGAEERDTSSSEDEEDKATGIAAKPRSIRFQDSESTSKDNDKEKDTRLTVAKASGLSSIQALMLKMAGQKIPDAASQSSQQIPEDKRSEAGSAKEEIIAIDASSASQPGQGAASNAAPIPPGSMFRPPLGVPLPVRLPPGPPPGRPPGLPPGPPPGLPPALRAMMPRLLPPGLPPPPRLLRPPPPGMPPPMMPPPGMLPPMPPGVRPAVTPNVLSAPPSIQRQPQKDDKAGSATIEAKPQIHHPIGEVTRFMPTSLRVKRVDSKKPARPREPETAPGPAIKSSNVQMSAKTKDDAYDQFMKEMEAFT